ncbi:hypothetical protein Tco_0147352, partial [Tanacetum coccineum]
LPGVRKELKLCEDKTVESSVDEPPEVIINKLPQDEEKAALLKVLKSYKRAIAWKLYDIKGVNPEFCTHKILMKEDYEPSVQIKKEVEKLLDAGLIYPISDSPWVSPVHCVPKKGGMTVITNDENELIPTRLVTGWRVCIDYRKLNEATLERPLPFAFYRPNARKTSRKRILLFPRWLLGLFSDPKRSRKDNLYLPIRNFCLSSHAFWAMQRTRHVPTMYDGNLPHDMIKKTMEVVGSRLSLHFITHKQKSK